MTVDTDEDLEKLRAIGLIVAQTLEAMKNSLHPGMTTRQLDEVGENFLYAKGATPAPRLVYHFPGATCISLNNEAAHGIPGRRTIIPGDLVNIDVSAEKDGYFADSALTIVVPPISPLQRRLLKCAKSALNHAIQVARAGQPINLIGRAVQEEADRCGFTILRDLTGHGVGRSIHEEPRQVLNFYNPQDVRVLAEGMVIAIEPFLSNGGEHILTSSDGWTLKTTGGALSAQFEHTVVITTGQPIILTALPSTIEHGLGPVAG